MYIHASIHSYLHASMHPYIHISMHLYIYTSTQHRFAWLYFKRNQPPILQNKLIQPMQAHRGYIEVIFGPMFSGKSSELLRKIRRFEHARKKCVVINYLHQNRYIEGDYIATHDKVTKKAIKTELLKSVIKQVQHCDVVGIDQGQFFEDIVEFCEELANQNIIILVAALDGTFQRKAFGKILNLIPLAEKVIKLNAVCSYCTKEASFSKRIVSSKEIQLIGGEEMYKPVCRACFFMENQHQSKAREITAQTLIEENTKNSNEELIALEKLMVSA